MAAPVEQRQRVLELLARDPEIDIIITAVNDADSPFTAAFVDDLVAFRRIHDAPVVLIWATPRPNPVLMQALVEAGIPVFRSTGGCMRAWRQFCAYQDARPGFRDRTVAPPKQVIELPTGPVRVLSTADTDSLLAAFDVPLARSQVVAEPSEAAEVAAALGFPVVMKIASADFPHKSDVGLVRLGIAEPRQAADAFVELIAQAARVDQSARVDGVLIQQQLAGTELIVGLTQDATLGPAVMVGLGGIFTEALSDVAVRPLPIDRTDVEEMIRSLRGFAILTGARGRSPANLERLYDLVLSVGALAQSCGDRLRELDLNPVVVTDEYAIAVDVLVIAGSTVEQPT
jgi:acyl-CoA synthetase (NDP forming)